jgi:uncharacterized alpha-E superfamily protein
LAAEAAVLMCHEDSPGSIQYNSEEPQTNINDLPRLQRQSRSKRIHNNFKSITQMLTQSQIRIAKHYLSLNRMKSYFKNNQIAEEANIPKKKKIFYKSLLDLKTWAFL